MKEDFNMLIALVKRNSKIYFKDKMTFFLSLITPLILIVLFITFLKNAYVDSLLTAIPEGFELSKKVIDGFTGGWLFSSILGVSTVTISFCSNMIMATDKINKNILDFNITPVKKHIVALGYFISNFISTFIVCFIAMVVGLIYLAIVGWYLTFVDILLILASMVISTLFGSLLSTIICSFLKSQGGVSAVSTLVSSMYGFLSGAYMPLSQSGKGLRTFVSFFPGTYGTLLFRRGFMRGPIEAMTEMLPQEVVNEIKVAFDFQFSVLNSEVGTGTMFLVLGLSSLALFGVFMLVLNLKKKAKNKEGAKW